MQSLPHTIEILERTPATLRTLLNRLSEHWTHGNYGDETWSAFEVVGHLIIAEQDDWLPRLHRILQHGEAVPFDPFSHDSTIRPDSGRRLADLLDEFNRLRAHNIDELRRLNLTDQDLARTGMHPSLGRVTALQLLSTWVVHDLHHIRQICLAMAWQYRDEVGPWRLYLNTLHR